MWKEIMKLKDNSRVLYCCVFKRFKRLGAQWIIGKV